MTTTTPRPPEGDWLGTPYLRFTREGPLDVAWLVAWLVAWRGQPQGIALQC